jgi:hypothetical protein
MLSFNLQLCLQVVTFKIQHTFTYISVAVFGANHKTSYTDVTVVWVKAAVIIIILITQFEKYSYLKVFSVPVVMLTGRDTFSPASFSRT